MKLLALAPILISCINIKNVPDRTAARESGVRHADNSINRPIPGSDSERFEEKHREWAERDRRARNYTKELIDYQNKHSAPKKSSSEDGEQPDELKEKSLVEICNQMRAAPGMPTFPITVDPVVQQRNNAYHWD